MLPTMRALGLQADRIGVDALLKDHERQRDHLIEVHVTEALEAADVLLDARSEAPDCFKDGRSVGE